MVTDQFYLTFVNFKCFKYFFLSIYNICFAIGLLSHYKKVQDNILQQVRNRLSFVCPPRSMYIDIQHSLIMYYYITYNVLLHTPYGVICLCLRMYQISFSLIISVHFFSRSVQGFNQSLIAEDSSMTNYIDKVFSGWDFCIKDEKIIKLKQKSILYELKVGNPINRECQSEDNLVLNRI